jgi:ABC-type phosphate/phosphonate transport system substrate-binding protein
MRVASLGMYDLPGIAAANDALWRWLAGELVAAGVDGVPNALDRSRPLEAIWDDPALLLAQTCGYPLVTRWRGRLRIVATPRYAAPGCEGAAYRSLLVARAGEAAAGMAAFRDRIAAINERESNSGHNLFRAAIAPLATGGRFFATVIETGSHHASATAVADGRADMAAIDAVTFAHLRRHDAALSDRLAIVATSPSSPGLPLVTAADASDELVALLRDALSRAASEPRLRAALDALLIEGFEVLPDGAYDMVLDLERDAIRAGYPTLA